jgi:cytochrome P450
VIVEVQEGAMSDTTIDPMPRTPNGYHPCDSETAHDPFAQLAELRAACPVSRAEHEGLPPVTLVTRYDDAAAVLRDYRTFGNIGFFPATVMYDQTPSELRSLIDLDPPEHTAARRLSLLAMKPAAVSESLPQVADAAREIVQALRPNGRAEIVRELAAPLPAIAIARVLGFPAEDADMLHDWVATTFSEAPADANQFVSSADRGAYRDLGSEFDQYLRDQFAVRRAASAPPDDAITRMLQVQAEDDSSFTDEQLIVNIRTLLTAGNETTTSLISNAIFRMLHEPGVYERVRSDHSLVEPLLEECLRVDTPLQQFGRRVLTDSAEIAGLPVGQGECLSVSYVSANRDAAQFGADAEEFDLDRYVDRPVDHLAFGLGIHHCVGSFLARQTSAIALHAVLEHLDDLALAPGYEWEKVWFFEFRRPKRLDVTFRAS